MLAHLKGERMFYVCEFEFFDDEEGGVTAFCLNEWGGATFGDSLEDAVESAADWLASMIDDALLNDKQLPPISFGHEPAHNGQVIAVAVTRDLSDIKSMSAADAARTLGVSRARITQLIQAGLLDSWKEGHHCRVTVDSVNARLNDLRKPDAPAQVAQA
jgi:predicted RNase H-like HicB family nuclease